MTDWLAIPPARALRGEIAVPGSKSASNRALAIASLSPRPTEIRGLLDSEDTRAMLACLAAMGARIERSGRTLRVAGPPRVPRDRVTELDAGDSGTAARFLAALCACVPGRFRLRGSPRLSERPMGELVAALRAGGAAIDSQDAENRLPLSIEGGSLRSGALSVDASRSSQFLSALLIAGAALPGGIEVCPTSALASAPYVELTVAALSAFGHSVERSDGGIRVHPGGGGPASYRIPGDYSSAVPLLAACGIAGGEIALTGLVFPSADPDARALPVLERIGIEIRGEGARVVARRKAGGPAPVSVRATDFPDAVPALAALAAFSTGESRFEGIEHLREKESDRIGALDSLLAAAGIEARAERDALAVGGSSPRAAAAPRRLPTFADHRIAMAAALLALRVPGTLIENPACVGKSYPGFFRDLESVCVRAS
jgi:3-phosphoshikimate 1-carboxyvinyltransferase